MGNNFGLAEPSSSTLFGSRLEVGHGEKRVKEYKERKEKLWAFL